ncbi:MAG: ATP-binding protein [Bacteroidales bacterium]|nr:ATP-binding protein [Bacteroidales bacterium]MDD4217667.1 ATP-binding protein [Bacteroidales bacterium]MDY0142947.1 ATP-binding protein [Bacteroidales bacterium]
MLVLLGARRTGKTFFIKELIENYITEPYILLNGEDMAVAEIFKIRTVENFKALVGSKKLLIIDEAQKLPEIGRALKLMIDTIEGLKIIAIGSSVFDLSNKLGEPLTGRKWDYYMYPFSQSEYSLTENLIETKSRLEQRLIFGSYPELLQYKSSNEKASYLNELINSYLFRDILEYDGIRNSDKILHILTLIAFQIGKEVSLEEIGRKVGISRNTVEKYLDLLSKVFVIFKLRGFSRNLRNEITKTSRWFFYDNGIRNALISNFNSLTLRNDIGELWENYLISERIKYQYNNNIFVNNYFWRTYQQQEIDLIEEKDGKLYAYEIKWNLHKKVKIPKSWKNAYPDSEFTVINRDNYLEWIT